MFVPCHPKNGHVFRLEGHPKLKCKTYNFENNFDLNSHLAFSLSGYCSCSYHFYEEGPYLHITPENQSNQKWFITKLNETPLT